jgi:hypothetical protein
MNRVLSILFLSLTYIAVSGQTNVRGEFANNPNGLMYSDADIAALRFTVDSLNLRYKSCALNQSYRAYWQTPGYHVYFTSEISDLKDVIRDLKYNMDFEQFIAKYSSYINNKVDTGQVIRTRSERDNNEFVYLFGNPGEGYDRFRTENSKIDLTKGNWYYDYRGKSGFSNYYSLYLYYFPEKWEQVVIPREYSQLIQYVDCMADTSTYIFRTERRSDIDTTGTSSQRPMDELLDYVNSKMKNKKKSRHDYLTPEKIKYIKTNLKDDPDFRKIIIKAADWCIQRGGRIDLLVEMLIDFGDYERALMITRSFPEFGLCSADLRPREQMKDISILAARSHKWDIFIRAHLALMNDDFQRMSDGSYAYEKRKTYLKELEELNLNIVDLMLGICLRSDNVADNHIYGEVWRLGWAMTESKDRAVFEERAIAMMKDEKLDRFNRGLIYLMYSSYLIRLEDAESKEKIKALKEDVSGFPAFMHASINGLKPKEIALNK